jgi:hypothetical protein
VWGRSHRREDGAAGNTHDEQSGTAPGVPTEPGRAEHEDDGVHDRLEAHDDDREDDGAHAGERADEDARGCGAASAEEEQDRGGEDREERGSDLSRWVSRLFRLLIPHQA